MSDWEKGGAKLLASVPPEMGVYQLNILIERLINEGKITAGGVGYYPSSDFVHCDVRGYYPTWRIG